MTIVLFAIFIGIMIGYFTNALAIKMLFRPLKPWNIGSWKIPLTPGLIPRRKEEIAESIGELVETYLFTPAGLKDFIEKTKLKEQTYLKLTEKIDKFLTDDLTAGKLLAYIFNDGWREELANLSGHKIVNLIHNEKVKAKSINDLLSATTITKIDDNLKLLSPYLTGRIKVYLQTIEGRRFIEDLLKQALEGKKVLGFFAGFFMEGNQFQDKVIVYLEQLLDDDKTQSMLQNLLYKEWNRIKSEPIGSFIDNSDELIKAEVEALIEKGLGKLETASLKGLYEYLKDYNVFTRIYDQTIEMVVSKIDNLFAYLSIAEVVKEEVNRFSLEKLERIIINIAGRELKMITYLGGLIGGLIGFFQGMLYLFL